MTPVKLNSILRDYVWGGRKLAQKYGKGNGSPIRIAESWESCDAMKRIPLQLKWIDTDYPTSLQVHPDSEAASRLGYSCKSGNEIWVIVESEPESRIGIGFRRDVSRKEILDALKARTLELLVNHVHPKPGECFVIPSGTLHYIDGGVTAIELKLPESLTLRLYDWERAATMDRTIHVAESLNAMNYGRFLPIQYDLRNASEPVGVNIGNVALELLLLDNKGLTMRCDESGFVTLLDGAMSIDDAMSLQAGETAFTTTDGREMIFVSKTEHSLILKTRVLS